MAFKVYKCFMNINPEFLWSCLNEYWILYNVRKGSELFLPPAKWFCVELNSVHEVVYYGATSLSSKVSQFQMNLVWV